MSDDIQKETERIHQGIVESLSFSEALAKRDAEIERLRIENSQWQSACAGYTKALAARDRDNAAKSAEIERLRELLRDAMDDVAGMRQQRF